MKWLLGVIIILVLLNAFVCSIDFINKFSRTINMTIQPDLEISRKYVPLEKMQFHFTQLSDACSIPEVPLSKRFSMHSTNHNREATILIVQDNDKCSISRTISRAEGAGYVGIIVCADSLKRFQYVSERSPNDDFYISVVLSCDRYGISKLDTKNYKLTINRDTHLIRDIFDQIKTVLGYAPLVLFFGIPVCVLLAAHVFMSNARFFEEKQSQSGTRQKRYDSKKSNELPSCEINPMVKLTYQRILNVGPNADRREIKEAFKVRALLFSADKNMDLGEDEIKRREEIFKMCIKAKAALLAELPE